MNDSPSSRRGWRALVAGGRAAAAAGCVLAALAGASAWGNDRPFQVARTAVMEDDEQVWSIESWGERRGAAYALSVEPEYTFDVANAVQVQFTRRLDRAGDESGHEVEIEVKHLFNSIARDGWGLGFSAALGAERSAGNGTTRRLELKLPLSIAFGDGGYLHLSPGWSKAGDGPRAWTTALAAEHPVWRRGVAFAEAAREGPRRYAQVGIRQWLRRERLALDLAWQQHDAEGRRDRGLVIGLGLYDL